jgi:hypothetical protein
VKCPSIKSPPLSYVNDLFLRKRDYYEFIVQNAKKHIFPNEISFENFKFGPRFN